jgi:hypothetical protein
MVALDLTPEQEAEAQRWAARIAPKVQTEVVDQRLCLSGMRWGEEGSDAVAHLRALYRSDADQWDAFWAIAG